MMMIVTLEDIVSVFLLIVFTVCFVIYLIKVNLEKRGNNTK